VKKPRGLTTRCRDASDSPASARTTPVAGSNASSRSASVVFATSGRDGGGSCRVRLGEFELEAAGGDTGASGEVRVVIRPERVRLEDYGTTGPNRVPGMVERLVYQGAATQLVVRLANGEPLQALVQNQGQPISWQQGTAIAVHLPADALRVLPESA